MGSTLGVYQYSEIDALHIRIWKLIDIRFGELTELAVVNFQAMLGDVPN